MKFPFEMVHVWGHPFIFGVFSGFYFAQFLGREETWEPSFSNEQRRLPAVAHSKYVEQNLSNETYPGWLGYKGDYTTQVFRDYDKPL